jgi:hypothetical protein
MNCKKLIFAGPYAWKMRLYLAWEGSTEKVLKLIEEAPQTMSLSEENYFVLASLLLYMFDGNYQKALDRLSLVSSDVIIKHLCFVPKTLLYAQSLCRLFFYELPAVLRQPVCRSEGLLQTRQVLIRPSSSGSGLQHKPWR